MISLCFVFTSLFVISYAEDPEHNQSSDVSREICQVSYDNVNEVRLNEFIISDESIDVQQLESSLSNVLYRIFSILDHSDNEGIFAVEKVIGSEYFTDIASLEKFLQAFFKKGDYFFFTGGISHPKEKCYVNPRAIRCLCTFYCDLHKMYSEYFAM